jgi:hypothetical protein
MALSTSSTTNFFEYSLSPSQKIDAAEYFVAPDASDVTLWDKASELPISVEDAFGPNAPDLSSALGLDSSQFLGGLAGSPQGWTFITAPEDINWDIANNAQRVDIFGTNNPPVVAGSRGMRDLTLSNSLVEGFVRGVTVEGKIAALENLMNYGLNASDGYVSVPVYQVWANEKSYGGPEAYYIIKDITVKEAMRDLKGNATRAYVDISLMQVPAYQVNSGRDQSSQVTAGGVALTPEQKKQVEAAAKKGTDGKTAQNAAKDQVDGAKNKQATSSPAGPDSAKPGPALLPDQEPNIRKPLPRP